MFCPTCNKSSSPVGELEPGSGVVQRCGNEECRARLPAEAPAPRRAPVAVQAAPGLALVQVAPAQPANVPMQAPQAAPSSEPFSARDLQSLARARLAFVETEIARLDAYREELTALRRMLGAVEAN